MLEWTCSTAAYDVRMVNTLLTESTARAQSEDTDVTVDTSVVEQFDEFMQHDRHGTDADPMLSTHNVQRPRHYCHQLYSLTHSR